MGAIKLQQPAAKEGVYGIQISFLDASGDPVVPKTLSWSLTDGEGDVINARKDVAVAIPAASVLIVLRDDDLAIIDQQDP